MFQQALFILLCMQNVKSYNITISGKVQNVGFRYHTKEKAIQLGIKGFVMNKANGKVYVEAEGTEIDLNEFIKWCHQGPNWSRVLNVNVIEQPLSGFKGFEVS